LNTIYLNNSIIFSKSPVSYTAVKGDNVDEMIGKFLRKFSVKIPILRIMENRYLFGTKTISA
jgi:hypothetical protein